MVFLLPLFLAATSLVDSTPLASILPLLRYLGFDINPTKVCSDFISFSIHLNPFGNIEFCHSSGRLDLTLDPASINQDFATNLSSSDHLNSSQSSHSFGSDLPLSLSEIEKLKAFSNIKVSI